MLAARWQRHPSDAEEWKSLRYWPCGKQGPVCSVRALALLMLAAGCGLSTRPQNPEQVVGQYSDALRAGDARRAWSLLSEEARRAMPFENSPTFLSMCSARPTIDNTSSTLSASPS